jgi:hypothetical protein
MYDGVDASRLPTTAQMVAGYVDGLYRWSDADWARFPNSVKVRIAVFSTTNDGHVLDVEPGNATPAQSVDWVLMRRKAGVDPAVYMNTSTWPVVRSAFQARGVTEPHYWVAQYDGVAVIPAGTIAKQYVNDEANGWDLSAVFGYWPGVDPAPTPAPHPVPAPVPIPQEPDMINFLVDVETGPNNERPGIWVWLNGVYSHVATIPDVDALKAAPFNLVQHTFSYGTHLAWVAATQSAN